jgi:hypothetical protein
MALLQADDAGFKVLSPRELESLKGGRVLANSNAEQQRLGEFHRYMNLLGRDGSSAWIERGLALIQANGGASGIDVKKAQATVRALSRVAQKVTADEWTEFTRTRELPPVVLPPEELEALRGGAASPARFAELLEFLPTQER